ncbi:MAG: tetratricopeptide repeat protein [Bacteroidetes bacterium]|jgi:tetratricopeptide (TPR) repeat protein|nr:tetratricopeptide repeat protein [Bacteroidota bacterium]|tara:strand:+ start:40 stop:1179 length:1140 start_codon:yes stop_codon:yes gene_type:complete
MKNAITFLFLLSAGALFGQKQVVSAFNANKSGDFSSAATYIDEAITLEKAAIKDKTWRYRGEIYLNIAQDSVLSRAYPQALWIASDSYKKAQELDVKESYKREIIIGLGLVQTTAGNQGISDYANENYGPAARKFDLSAEVAGMFDVLDTMAIFNAALCYEKANDIDNAVARYKTCGESGYQVPNVYLFAANILRQNGRTEDALIELQSARVQFPREQSLIIEELNIYLEAQDYARAENNLKLAAEGDPDNEILWFSLGSVYDNLDKTEMAAEAYLKAISIAPDYFDANYNLGAMYFNQAVEGINAANDMWKPRMTKAETAQQKTIEDGAKDKFLSGRPYLEAAHNANPEDLDTVRSLRDIYARTGQDDLMLKMSALLK